MTAPTQDTHSHVVPTPRSRITRSRMQKESLVEQFNASGLTKTAFCKHHGVAISCLTRWQKASAAEFQADAFVDITESLTSAAAPRPAPEEHPRWQVELELGAGVVLRVRTG